MSSCVLCPRKCGANRAAGEKGWCKAGNELEIFSSFPHHGEEPPISGDRGSGTVFFSRCTLSCIYCQNHRWSQDGEGSAYKTEGLARIFEKLRDAGCHNWNLVSPTPWLPWITKALRKANGVSLPVVYNSSGYERVETLRALENFVDVYLVDLRYALNAGAAEASSVKDYVENARAAVMEMWRQKGELVTDKDDHAISGTICRILVLPERETEACGNLRWLAETIGTEISLSIMAQYTPAHKSLERAPWNRRVTRDEYQKVCDEAEKSGFDKGWIQEYGSRCEDDLIGFNMRAE